MPDINVKDLVREARRRRVFRTAGLYIVGAWVVVQIALAVFPALSIVEEAVRFVWFAAILGFPVAIIFGWRYDFRGGRIVKTGPVSNDVPLSLQRADAVILAALGFVALAILAGSLQQITDMQPEQNQPFLPADIDQASVAVLPFANVSADPNNEYFSDGLTDTLLHMLAQLPDIKVTARTSSFAFKGQNEDIRQIASSLGVAHILEGSVQRADGKVRVTAQLIRAADGVNIWSQNYDRDLNDIFKIQDEISSDVATALGSSLLGNQLVGLRGVNTTDISAYDIYLRGLEQEHINTQASLTKAEQLYLTAIEADSDFIDAKLGLARTYLWQGWKNDDIKTERYKVANELLEGVNESHPDSLSARLMHHIVQFFVIRAESTNWGFDETQLAIQAEIRALTKSGTIDSFVTQIAVNVFSGRSPEMDEEALELLSAALEADPLNFELLWAQADLFRITGRADQARQPLLTAVQLAPHNPEVSRALGYLARNQMNYTEAFEWFRKANKLDPAAANTAGDIAALLYYLGYAQEGDVWLEKVRAIEPDSCRVSRLEVYSAEAAADQERLIKLVKRDLRLVVSQANVCYYPIDFYVWTMAERNEAHEGIEFLSELVPNLQDYANPVVDNRRVQYIQAMSLFLLGEVVDQTRFRELVTEYRRAIAVHFPDLDDYTASVYPISYDYILGNTDKAKTLFLETYTQPTLSAANTWRWERFLRYPWLEKLRQDPQVAPFVDQYLQLRQDQAAEVGQMLQKPEWQSLILNQ